MSSGGRIRTCDLRVMSPTSYQTAPPRGGLLVIADRPQSLGFTQGCEPIAKRRRAAGRPPPRDHRLVTVSAQFWCRDDTNVPCFVTCSCRMLQAWHPSITSSRLNAGSWRCWRTAGCRSQTRWNMGPIASASSGSIEKWPSWSSSRSSAMSMPTGATRERGLRREHGRSRRPPRRWARRSGSTGTPHGTQDCRRAQARRHCGIL